MRIGILQTGRTPEELRNKHGDYDDMFAGSRWARVRILAWRKARRVK